MNPISDTSLHWHPVGAHLLQAPWPTHAHSGIPPLFYVSPLVSQFPDRPPRGGVPVMFPQFADRGPGPKHGLVRMRPWQPLSALDVGGMGAGAVGQAGVGTGTGASHRSDACQNAGLEAWTIEVPAQPAESWMGHARLSLQAAWQDDAFCMRMEVLNTGSAVFEWTGGLHPYWAFDDITALVLNGLDETPFEDRYESAAPVSQPFLTGQAFERLYRQAPALRIHDARRMLQLSCTGFDNWMVWNPGIELATGLPDLPDSDWMRFVCIEPVVAARPVSLEPGQRFVGTMQVKYDAN